MSMDKLCLYRQLQDAKRTKTILKLMNNLKAELYEDIHHRIADLASIGRVIGYEDMIEELRKAIELLEVEMKY